MAQDRQHDSRYAGDPRNKVYLENGQDPESRLGPANLYAIDATKRGDISSTGQLWCFAEIKRSISSVAIYQDLLFAADLGGYLYCLDAATGKPHWTHDMLGAMWASPIVIDAKVHLTSADGDVVILNASSEKKLLFQTNMGSSVFSTFVPANGTPFLTSRDTLFALAQK